MSQTPVAWINICFGMIRDSDDAIANPPNLQYLTLSDQGVWSLRKNKCKSFYSRFQLSARWRHCVEKKKGTCIVISKHVKWCVLMIQVLNLYLYCHILMQTGEGGWDNSFKPYPAVVQSPYVHPRRYTCYQVSSLNLIAANTAIIRCAAILVVLLFWRHVSITPSTTACVSARVCLKGPKAFTQWLSLKSLRVLFTSHNQLINLAMNNGG